MNAATVRGPRERITEDVQRRRVPDRHQKAGRVPAPGLFPPDGDVDVAHRDEIPGRRARRGTRGGPTVTFCSSLPDLGRVATADRSPRGSCRPAAAGTGRRLPSGRRPRITPPLAARELAPPRHLRRDRLSCHAEVGCRGGSGLRSGPLRRPPPPRFGFEIQLVGRDVSVFPLVVAIILTGTVVPGLVATTISTSSVAVSDRAAVVLDDDVAAA